MTPFVWQIGRQSYTPGACLTTGHVIEEKSVTVMVDATHSVALFLFFSPVSLRSMLSLNLFHFYDKYHISLNKDGSCQNFCVKIFLRFI